MLIQLRLIIFTWQLRTILYATVCNLSSERFALYLIKSLESRKLLKGKHWQITWWSALAMQTSVWQYIIFWGKDSNKQEVFLLSEWTYHEKGHGNRLVWWWSAKGGGRDGAGMEAVTGDGERLDLGWWTHSTAHRWCAAELCTWHLDNFVNQCHPKKVNEKKKKEKGHGKVLGTTPPGFRSCNPHG